MMSFIIAGYVCLLAHLMSNVACLYCVQCSSLIDPDCEDGNMPAQNCSKFENPRYCVKYEGTISKGKVVFRDCSEVDMKSNCSNKDIVGRSVLVCYSTCSTDGCNSAPWMEASVYVILLPAVTYICSLIFNLGFK